MNAADLLLRSPPRTPALRDGTRVVGYGALRRRVAATAAGWRAEGMAPRARCALVLDDGIDWVVAFLGLVWLGALPVPLCADTEPAAIAALVHTHDLHWMLAEDRVAASQPLRRRQALRVVSLTDWLGLQLEAPGSPRAQPSAPEASAWLRPATDDRGRPVLEPHSHAQMLAPAATGGIATPVAGGARFAPALHASRLCEGGAGLHTLLAGLGRGALVAVGHAAGGGARPPRAEAFSRPATS